LAAFNDISTTSPQYIAGARKSAVISSGYKHLGQKEGIQKRQTTARIPRKMNQSTKKLFAINFEISVQLFAEPSQTKL